MEGYLRLALLVIAAVIIFLILFEAKHKRRQVKASALSASSNMAALSLDPDEVLGLNIREPMIVDTEITSDFSALESPAESHSETGDFVAPKQEDEELIKILSVPPFVKEEDLPSLSADFDLRESDHSSAIPVVELKQAPSPSVQQDEIKDLVVLSVFAKPGHQFASYELLQSISATGMQFGEMNIFHYYEMVGDNRVTLFSLVSATEPGEFDLDRIGDIACAGLTLFIKLYEVPNPQLAFDLMLKTAEQLVDDLDGELRAGTRTPWSESVRLQYQEKVSYYQFMKQI